MPPNPALVAAASLEAARVYGQYSPEHKLTGLDLADEIRHFDGCGWLPGRIALRLGTTKAHVKRTLASAR